MEKPAVAVTLLIHFRAEYVTYYEAYIKKVWLHKCQWVWDLEYYYQVFNSLCDNQRCNLLIYKYDMIFEGSKYMDIKVIYVIKLKKDVKREVYVIK